MTHAERARRWMARRPYATAAEAHAALGLQAMRALAHLYRAGELTRTDYRLPQAGYVYATREANLPPPPKAEPKPWPVWMDALDWLREYGPATSVEYAEDMDLPDSTAYKRLRKLVSRDLATWAPGGFRVTEAGLGVLGIQGAA